MATKRRSQNRVSNTIWPGFVDSMAALILVLVFVLSIFMIIQFSLREVIVNREKDIANLDENIAEKETMLELLGFRIGDLAQTLSLERERNENLEARLLKEQALVQTLSQSGARQEGEIKDLQTRIAQFLVEKSQAQREIAAKTSENDQLAAQNYQLTARLIDKEEAFAIAIANARDEIDKNIEEARLIAARRDALEALVATLQSDLDAKEAALAAKDSDLATKDAALAVKDSELDAKDAALASLLSQLDDETASKNTLNERLVDLQGKLDEKEKQRLIDAAAFELLRSKLAAADTELVAMLLALEGVRAQSEETLLIIAAAEGAKKRLEEAQEITEGADYSAQERMAILREITKGEIDRFKNLDSENARKFALFNQQIFTLNQKLLEMQALIQESATREAAANVQIERLGSDLNAALARVAGEQTRRAEVEEELRLKLEAEAKELRNFRSEFFGRMRRVLRGRSGVKISGDRFIFDSQVLFNTGEALISFAGRREIDAIVDLLQEIATDIPNEIDWVIRVDGHTDSRPIRTLAEGGRGKYANNWELSQARALAVVQYMTDAHGFPANRLIAAGFGEFHPVDTGVSEAALRRNRRIELKLTER